LKKGGIKEWGKRKKRKKRKVKIKKGGKQLCLT